VRAVSLSSAVGFLEVFPPGGGRRGRFGSACSLLAAWPCVGATAAIYLGAIYVQIGLDWLGFNLHGRSFQPMLIREKPFVPVGFVLQDAVCEECGDVGVQDLLLRCSKCKNAARHRYASRSC